MHRYLELPQPSKVNNNKVVVNWYLTSDVYDIFPVLKSTKFSTDVDFSPSPAFIFHLLLWLPVSEMLYCQKIELAFDTQSAFLFRYTMVACKAMSVVFCQLRTSGTILLKLNGFNK